MQPVVTNLLGLSVEHNCNYVSPTKMAELIEVLWCGLGWDQGTIARWKPGSPMTRGTFGGNICPCPWSIFSTFFTKG